MGTPVVITGISAAEVWLSTIVFWLIAMGLTGWVASTKRRDVIQWLVWGLLFGPLALLAVGLASRDAPSFLSGEICSQCGQPFKFGHATLKLLGEVAPRRICTGEPTAHQLNELRLVLERIERQLD